MCRQKTPPVAEISRDAETVRKERLEEEMRAALAKADCGACCVISIILLFAAALFYLFLL